MIKVVLVGSGNVAQHLAKVFQTSASIDLIQVVARNPIEMKAIVPETRICTDFQQIADASVYVLAISDNAINEVAQNLPFENRLVVHTSGSAHLNIIGTKNKQGVFYPLQTFSKNKTVNFKSIPICIEAQFEDDFLLLTSLAVAISDKVYPISSLQRRKLHLVAVFVCNFVNHFYHIGASICEENEIPFEILQPLIEETAIKIKSLSPAAAQTGPALRNDTETIAKHLELLQDETFKELYILTTKSIQNVKKL